MGINKRQFLFNQIAASDVTQNVEDVFNSDLEEVYYKRLLNNTLQGNPSFSTLPNWIKKRALVQLNQSPARILCIGDSTTAGVYSDSYSSAVGTTNQGGSNSYPSQLAARLTGLGLSSQYSFCLPGHAGNADSRWALGGWSYAGFGAAQNAALTLAGAGASAVVTPNVSADRYIVYYYADSGTGSFTATATGGVAGTATSQGSAGVYKLSVSATSASASNTVTLAWVSGTVFVLGIEYYSSASPNTVRVFNVGVGGSTSSDWAQQGAAKSSALISAIAPDLTIISLGINDAGASASTQTVQSNVSSIANTVGNDVVVMSAIPHNAVGLVDTYNASFLVNSNSYLDLQRRWKNNAQNLGLVTTDNTHPNALGYADIANFIANTLIAA